LSRRLENHGFTHWPYKLGICIGRCSLPRSVAKHSSKIRADKRQTKAYNVHIKYLNWDPQKNEILKKEQSDDWQPVKNFDQERKKAIAAAG